MKTVRMNRKWQSMWDCSSRWRAFGWSSAAALGRSADKQETSRQERRIRRPKTPSHPRGDIRRGRPEGRRRRRPRGRPISSTRCCRRCRKVTVVNRDQIKKVADEHQIALSGLVDNSSAVKLGKFLSAQYIVVGRASKIGQTFYLVLKIVDVETTVQTTVSAKAAAESGFEAVLERLSEPLTADIRRLQHPDDRSRRHRLGRIAQAGRAAWRARCCWCRSRRPTSAGRCAIRPPRWPSCSGFAAWD